MHPIKILISHFVQNTPNKKKKTSGVDTKPQNPVASIKCYDLMAYKVFMEEVCHIKFGGGSFDWKVKVLAPILRLKSDR